jgi:hypothetical protein
MLISLWIVVRRIEKRLGIKCEHASVQVIPSVQEELRVAATSGHVLPLCRFVRFRSPFPVNK